MAVVALSFNLAVTNSRAVPCAHLLVEPRHQFVEQLLIAVKETRFRMAVRMVMSALAWRIHSSTDARGVADLEPHIPQTIKDHLGDGLAQAVCL